MCNLKNFVLLIFILFSGLSGCAPKHEQQTLATDHIMINFSMRGSGKPALVFVHGWCCDKSYWKHQVPYFAENYKVITIDLAGHGKSGLGRKTWSMEAFGNDVVAVLENLEIDQAILIGHSMGGAVIIAAAKQMPNRIIGLVGVDTYHDIEVKYSQKEIEGFISPFKNNFAGTSRDFVRSMFTPDADSELLEKISKDMSSAPPEVGIGAMRELFGYDLTRALKDLQIPIVCINSDKWPTNVDAGRRHIVSFEVKLMPGIGHFVMLEDPENFNKLLAKAVDELCR